MSSITHGITGSQYQVPGWPAPSLGCAGHCAPPGIRGQPVHGEGELLLRPPPSTLTLGATVLSKLSIIFSSVTSILNLCKIPVRFSLKLPDLSSEIDLCHLQVMFRKIKFLLFPIVVLTLN